MAIRLRALSDENGVFHIRGSADGLRYLSEIAEAIIGQPPGPNHYVIGPGFNADDDSDMFMLCYDQALEEGRRPPDAEGPAADPAT